MILNNNGHYHRYCEYCKQPNNTKSIMEIIKVIQHYYYGIVKTQDDERKIIVYTIGDQLIGTILIYSFFKGETSVKHIDSYSDCGTDLLNIAQSVVNQGEQGVLSTVEEGYIIKTNEFDDARYFLKIYYTEKKVSIKPSFYSAIVEEIPYDGRSSVELFQDLHKQLLPKFEQYYRNHKQYGDLDLADTIRMNRLEKLLKVNGYSAD